MSFAPGLEKAEIVLLNPSANTRDSRPIDDFAFKMVVERRFLSARGEEGDPSVILSGIISTGTTALLRGETMIDDVVVESLMLDDATVVGFSSFAGARSSSMQAAGRIDGTESLAV